MAIPSTVDPSSASFTRASDACGFQPDRTGFAARDSRRTTQVRQQLLLQSGIALAGMALLSQGALPETLATISPAGRPSDDLPQRAPIPRRSAPKPVTKKAVSSARPRALPQVTLEFEPEVEPRSPAIRRPKADRIDITRSRAPHPMSPRRRTRTTRAGAE